MISPGAAAVLVFALIPLTFLATPRLMGIQPSGLAWLLGGALATAALVALPLRREAVRAALPYLFFTLVAIVSLGWAESWSNGPETLAQVTVPVVLYLIGWHVDPGSVLPIISRISRLAIVLSAGLVGIEEALGGVPIVDLSTRPLGISLALLFIVATIDSPSLFRSSAFGAVCVGVGFLTGSRTASAVILVLILTSPALSIRPVIRFLLIVACVAGLLALSETPAFKERFFFNPDQATLQDAVNLTSQLNTAGRRELWPQLVEVCGDVQPRGLGIGTAFDLSAKLSNGGMTQPHNDYLRVWCETGIVGASAFFLFFASVTFKALRAVVQHRGNRTLQLAGAQLVLALILFALTDNPIIYTAHFMAPAMLVLGLAAADAFRLNPERPSDRTGVQSRVRLQ